LKAQRFSSENKTKFSTFDQIKMRKIQIQESIKEKQRKIKHQREEEKSFRKSGKNLQDGKCISQTFKSFSGRKLLTF
jgi:hypothetical protein